ncbi:MAG: hypothetical protein SF051_15215 [Elusimicrobiota bacterium]|nr:hypothetical protein [Elusimicrobiota bacterium]
MNALALLLLAVLPADAARHKLSVRLVDGEVSHARTLTAEEMTQADSAAPGTPSARPLLVSAVVSREADGVHLVEYQLAYDDRDTGRTFNAQGAATLARGERLRVITCGDYAVELGLDAKPGAADWPAGDAQNFRLTAELGRAGRTRSCRTVARLGTQLNLDMGSGPKGRRTTLRYAHALSGPKSKLNLEYELEDLLAGGAKLSLLKTESLAADKWAERDGPGYTLSWLAESPPKKAAPKPVAAKPAPPAPKPVKPVPRPRLQSSGGIGFGASGGGGGGSAPTATVAPTIPIPELPAAKPPEPEPEAQPEEEAQE